MKKISIAWLCCWMFTASLSAQTIHKIKMKELLHLIDTSTGPLVVNFWASWCGPCVREIPWFEKNIASFNGPKIKLILVSIDFADEYPKGIAEFVKKNNYKSDIYWLNETETDVYCPQIDKKWDGTIPVTLMVNNKKKYRQFLGQQLPEPRLLLELRKLTE